MRATLLPVEKPPAELLERLTTSDLSRPEGGTVSLVIKNHDESSRLRLKSPDGLGWHDMLPREVVKAIVTEQFVAVACVDGSLYLYSPAGRRCVSGARSSRPRADVGAADLLGRGPAQARPTRNPF